MKPGIDIALSVYIVGMVVYCSCSLLLIENKMTIVKVGLMLQLATH